MHRSRLAGFIIDCKTDDLEQAAAVLERGARVALKPREEEPDPLYRQLLTQPEDCTSKCSRWRTKAGFTWTSRADDIEAEVRRLEALGAKRVDTVSDLVRDGSAHRPAILCCPSATLGLRGARKRLEIGANSLQSELRKVMDAEARRWISCACVVRIDDPAKGEEESMILAQIRQPAAVVRPRVTPDPDHAAELQRRMNALEYSPENGFHRDRSQDRASAAAAGGWCRSGYRRRHRIRATSRSRANELQRRGDPCQRPAHR